MLKSWWIGKGLTSACSSPGGPPPWHCSIGSKHSPCLWLLHTCRGKLSVEGPQKLLSMPGLPSTLCMCASSDGAYRGSRTAFREELRDPNTWYLVDAQLPKLVPAITVQTSSPDHEKTYVSIYCSRNWQAWLALTALTSPATCSCT